MLGLSVPLLGIIITLAAFAVGSKKAAETGAAMAGLNMFCTLAQVVTGQMMIMPLFITACVVGAFYLIWKRARFIDRVIILLLAVQVGNYGSYFFFAGADSEPWRVIGNAVILAIYSVVAGGAVYEYLDHRHGGLSGDGDPRDGLGGKSRLAEK